MSLFGQPSNFRSSFQFKLFRLFTVLTAVMTIIFTVIYSVAELRKSHALADKVLELQARGFAETLRLPLYAENHELLEQAAREITTLPEIRAVEIAAADGRVLARSPSPFPFDTGNLMARRADVHAVASIHSLASALDTGAAKNQVIGFVTLYRTTDDLAAAARRLLFSAVASGLLFWILVSFSCYRLLKRVTRSFQRLMVGLEHIHAGDYETVIPVLSDDEPGRASAAVNDLAEALKRRERENSLLNAELRTAMEIEIATKEQLARVNQDLEEEISVSTQARQELKQLVERLPVGIVWSGAGGDIEYVNGFMPTRFGYAKGEAQTIEQWFAGMIPDEGERRQVLANRRMAIEACREDADLPTFYDLRIACKDGTQRDLSMGVQVSGERVIDIVIDMTEREQLQQQIIRNQKLESIGVLAAGIAHNFNNALTGVLGFISFARRFLDPEHRAFKPLENAERASIRAAEMARQLLTFAKGGAPIRKVVSVEKLIHEALSLATSGSRIVSRIELPIELHPLFVDEGQISQAFNCLCINAVQAMKEGGTLTVRGRNVTTDEETLPVPAPGSYVEIAFRDQGCGIPEKDQGNIFTPYFTTKAEVGTGLGLATVHSIVTRHGGAINFISKVGQGTTFTMYLPVASVPVPLPEPARKQAEAPVQAPPAVAPPGPRVGGKSVLVMDDEEMIRALVVEVLEDHGYQVTPCASGEEATERYREAFQAGRRYLAAILDLTVPGGIGGKEVARQILAIDPKARLIVSSGHSDDQVMTSFKEYGFCAAAGKPYHADELLRLLSDLQANG